MKVAYVFRNDMSATFQLASMILPQLEQGTHGVEVVGMMFFDENVNVRCAEVWRRVISHSAALAK